MKETQYLSKLVVRSWTRTGSKVEWDSLLEGSILGVTRGLGVGAGRLLSLAADLAVEARVGEPLDTNGVSDLERGRRVVSNSDD